MNTPTLTYWQRCRLERQLLSTPDARVYRRTLADGWAYKKLYTSETARRAALAGWLHQYNHHRPHSALGGLPRINRLDNLAGHHS